MVSCMYARFPGEGRPLIDADELGPLTQTTRGDCKFCTAVVFAQNLTPRERAITMIKFKFQSK